MLQLILSKNPYAFLKRLNWFGLIRFGAASFGEAVRFIRWLALKREIRKVDERIAELESVRRAKIKISELKFEKFVADLKEYLAESEKTKKEEEGAEKPETYHAVHTAVFCLGGPRKVYLYRAYAFHSSFP